MIQKLQRKGMHKAAETQYVFKTENGKSYTQIELTLPGKISRAIFAWLIMTLMLAGCYEVYTIIMIGQTGTAGILFWVSLVTAILTGTTLFLSWKNLWLLQAGILGVIGLLFRGWLYQGSIIIANVYLVKWNRYYGTNMEMLKVSREWSYDHGTTVIYLLLLAAYLMCMGLLKWKKVWVILIPPVLFSTATMIVGYAPRQKAVGLFIVATVGALIYCVGDRSLLGQKRIAGKPRTITPASPKRIYLGLILMGITAIGVSVLMPRGEEKARQVIQMRGTIEETACKTVTSIINYVAQSNLGWDIFDLNNPGRVTNFTPQYEDKEVLALKADVLPIDTVYLRGYVGDAYEHGKWVSESAAFTETSADWKDSIAKNAAKQVAAQVFDSQGTYMAWAITHYEIDYIDVNTDYAYLPYYTNASYVMDAGTQRVTDLEFDGDGAVKRKNQPGILVQGFSMNNLLSMNISMEQIGKQKLLSEAYSDYVHENYLSVPDNLTQLKSLGDVLKQNYERYYKNQLSQESWNMTVTSEELCCVYLVQQALEDHADYSLKLEMVPWGKDVVENFLFNSHKGYCEHYASAGVLLLREMGIPARYVSGYAVSKNEFSQNTDGIFEAHILDSEAHAWVEIYLENVGWVPVDLTEGSNTALSDLFMTSDGETVVVKGTDGDKQISFNYDPNQVIPKQEIDYGEQAAIGGEDDATDISGEEQQKEETQAALDQAEEQLQNTQSSETSETAKAEGKMTKTARWMVLLVLLLAAVTYIMIAKFRQRNQMLALYYIRKKDYRAAVQVISRQVYKILRRKRIISNKAYSDVEFRQILLEKLTEIQPEIIEGYCKKIELAAYSRQNLTREDVRVCQLLLIQLRAYGK